MRDTARDLPFVKDVWQNRSIAIRQRRAFKLDRRDTFCQTRERQLHRVAAAIRRIRRRLLCHDVLG